MRQAIHFKASGILAMIPPDGNPGKAFPPERFTPGTGDLVKVDVEDELVPHIDKQHCTFQNGKVNLKPEKEWLENKPEEELSPLEQRFLDLERFMHKTGLTKDQVIERFGTLAREVL